MAFLYQIVPDGSPIQYWTLGDTPLIVGSGDFADAYVEDETLSGSHFLIVRERDDFIIVDLQSSNGTWVNDRQVLAHRDDASQIA